MQAAFLHPHAGAELIAEKLEQTADLGSGQSYFAHLLDHGDEQSEALFSGIHLCGGEKPILIGLPMQPLQQISDIVVVTHLPSI